MAIPDFQSIMHPLLTMVADDQDHAVADLRERLAAQFALTPKELEEMLPSGRAKMFANRVGWPVTYLYHTKLLERPKRSVYRITPRGHQVLAENRDRVDLKVLGQFDELHELRDKGQAVKRRPRPTSARNPTSPIKHPRSRWTRRIGCCEARSRPTCWSG